ncbi:MAG: hypothetical protein HYV65_00900 [Candidatus Spechtbacteria bacterium]|nr:hypothetical protein [Candidatus Spechtbacteria bacterium]
MSAVGALVCLTGEYDIPAIENGHMNPDEEIDKRLAMREWTDLVNLLQMFGLSVRLMCPRENGWDNVFAANGGWAHGDRALLANFRQPIRRPEQPVFRDWFERLGFDRASGKLRLLPPDIFWEGQGDTLVGGSRHVFLGYGMRSSDEAAPYIQDMLEQDEVLVLLHLVSNYFYHLDTAANALKPRNAFIYYPPAFAQESRDKIRSLPMQLMALSPFLANCFVANSIYIDDVYLLNVPFNASEESRLLSAKGQFIAENDPRFRELMSFDRGDWKNNAHLVNKMKKQGIRHPFRVEGLDMNTKAGYVWFIRELWKLGMKVIPMYTSQFEPSGAGGRCCVMFLDWLPAK